MNPCLHFLNFTCFLQFCAHFCVFARFFVGSEIMETKKYVKNPITDQLMIRKILERHKGFPCLYDSRNENFKKRVVKETAIKTIYNDLKESFNLVGITAEHVKSKLENLVSNYRNIRKKFSSTSTGQSAKLKVTSLWYYEILDEYLAETTGVRTETIDNFVSV